MDNNLFLKKLSELANWERPLVGPNGEKSQKKHSAKVLTEDAEDEQELDLDPDSTNECIAPVIIGIKPKEEQCPDCNKICDDRRKLEAKFSSNPLPHWRIKCLNCKCYKNPNSGLFEIEKSYSLQNAYRTYFYRFRKDIDK
jgi:hypothetical protein